MPRKPEPSFSVKQIIWDIAGTAGTDSWSALYREINHKLEELWDEGKLLEDIPNERKVRDIIELDIQRLPQEVVLLKLPPHVWRLRNDYEKIKQLAGETIKNEQDKAKQRVVIEQEPYEETPHKLKMRELARALAQRISLPYPMMKDLWPDLPVEFQPGNYFLPIGVVEIGEGRQVKLTYHGIGAGGIAAPHLVKGLHSHLSTSGLSRFAELVGDKGKLEDWVSEVGEYSEALIRFLKLIADKVKGYRAKVYFHDEAKPGLTKWFIVTAWNDAIEKAEGYSCVEDWWYKPYESIAGTILWQARCGAYAIGIAKSKRTLKTYENWHKKLRLEYAKNPLAEKMATKYHELSKVTQDIRQRLQEFSDMERLPGHCELCLTLVRS